MQRFPYEATRESLPGARVFAAHGRGTRCWSANQVFAACLTFELSRPRRQTTTGRGGMMTIGARSGQALAAVAGRLERGVRRHPRSAAICWHCVLDPNDGRWRALVATGASELTADGKAR